VGEVGEKEQLWRMREREEEKKEEGTEEERVNSFGKTNERRSKVTLS
jgi:hypothetical protein